MTSSPIGHLLLRKQYILQKNVNTSFEFLTSEENVGKNWFWDQKSSGTTLFYWFT